MIKIVLVHGAYQGGRIWRDVAAILRAQGHDVRTPTLDGCAERAGALRPGITTETHADELARLLFHEDLTDATLVGTSTGGMVIARAPNARASAWAASCCWTRWPCWGERPCRTSSIGATP